MLRLLRRVVTTLCAGVALAGLAVASPAAASPAAASPTVALSSAPAPAPATRLATGTSDFSFDSWHSDLRLGVTAEGHSELTTTETIVARFPDFDQNHGIRRAIPTSYRGHPTGLEIESVTDENGVPRSYATATSSDNSGDFLEVTIAADGFVHGANTYRITYRQTNVTFVPQGSNDDQFYWEVNGTGWGQPFGDVSATVLIDPAISDKLTGQVRCLQGAADSGAECASLTSEAEDDGWRIEAATGPLNAHEGLALVVGFEPATFVPRDESFLASPFPSIGLAGALIALAGLALGWIGRAGPWRNAPGRPTIIAEYLPPKWVSLLSSANVSGSTSKLVPALILSFAVRGNLRVLEERGTKKYTLKLVHAGGLVPSEFACLSDLFPGLRPGTPRTIKKRDTLLAQSLHKTVAAVPQQVIAEGLRVKKGGPLRWWALILGSVGLPLSVVASVIALSQQIGGIWPVLTLVVGFGAGVLALVLASVVRPLTAAGAELRDYLAGLKLYIKLAEADRMRVLQSPQGALRSPYRPDADDAAFDPAGQLDVLKLSERLLPYAALFGLEKEWSAVLGDYYARNNAEPDWYFGSSAFNAAYFGTAIASLSSSASSWAGTAGSSGSSGFGGGGSVGGGGGGGGGGGV